MTALAETLAKGLVDAWNEHDPEKVQSFYTPDCIERDIAMRDAQHGSDSIRKLMKYYLRAFPDVRVTIEEVISNGDDRAVLVWTWEGTHQGRFMNIPATGRRVQVRGTTIITVCNERVHLVDRIWDVAGLLRGLGLLPEL